MWAVRHFRQYLYAHRCHVHTDHEALKSLLNSPHPSGKLASGWGGGGGGGGLGEKERERQRETEREGGRGSARQRERERERKNNYYLISIAYFE